MKLTKSKLRQIIKEELGKVYDPAMGYDVEVEPEPEPVSKAATSALKNLYKKYVSDHKKEKEMGFFTRLDAEWQRTAENFLNYLEVSNSRFYKLAKDGFREEGVDFFNNLGIPLKR